MLSKAEHWRDTQWQMQSIQLLTSLCSQQLTEVLLENASVALGTELCWQLHPGLLCFTIQNSNLKPLSRPNTFNLEVWYLASRQPKILSFLWGRKPKGLSDWARTQPRNCLPPWKISKLPGHCQAFWQRPLLMQTEIVESQKENYYSYLFIPIITIQLKYFWSSPHRCIPCCSFGNPFWTMQLSAAAFHI